MTPSFQLLLTSLVTIAAGVAMLRIGVRSGLLRARVERRRCASCGRRINGWHCPACSHR
jgi:hypothetical protein